MYQKPDQSAIDRGQDVIPPQHARALVIRADAQRPAFGADHPTRGHAGIVLIDGSLSIADGPRDDAEIRRPPMQSSKPVGPK